MQQEIFDRLEMTATYLPDAARDAPETAVCYLPFADPPLPAPWATKTIAGFTPAGGAWSSAAEMGRFLAFLTAPPGPARQSVAEMVQHVATLPASRYTGQAADAGVGLGWFVATLDGRQLAEHGGADPSTAADVGWLPEERLAVFVAANSGGDPTAVALAATSLLRMALASGD